MKEFKKIGGENRETGASQNENSSSPLNKKKEE
jgi:hypothetical protein